MSDALTIPEECPPAARVLLEAFQLFVDGGVDVIADGQWNEETGTLSITSKETPLGRVRISVELVPA